MICARFHGDNLFAFSKFSAASGMFASLAIALTVPGLIPPISLATAVAFGLALSAAVIFARASEENLIGSFLAEENQATRIQGASEGEGLMLPSSASDLTIQQ